VDDPHKAKVRVEIFSPEGSIRFRKDIYQSETGSEQPMKLHWSPRSPFVRKVMVAAYEKGIAEQLELTRSVVPTDDSDHVIFADNPMGKIPTLVANDGSVWFDSSVILEAMDGIKPTPRMFPETAQARLETRRREALGNGIMEFMVGWVTERYNPSQRTEAMMARAANKLEKSLDHLEATIDRYVEVDAGSVAVACALSYVDFRFSNVEWRASRSRLSNWHATFSKRPSMIQTEFKDG
jgi:glutathione S-transferase